MNIAVIATFALTLLLVTASLAAMVRPQVFAGVARYFVEPWGIWLAAGIRLFAALALWFAAPASQFPGAFRILALVALAAAVGVLLAGHERVKRLIGWTVSRPTTILRLFAALALALGAFLLWGLLG